MNGRYWHEHNSQQKLIKFSSKILTQYKFNVAQFSEHVHAYADASLLHELRIACKNLRYSIELYASLYAAKKTQRYLKGLTKLQDTLGEINDHVVALRLLTEAGQGGQQKILVRMSKKIEHGHAKQVKQLHKNWAQFVKQEDFWN
jgi:CHAD domain-containing protein